MESEATSEKTRQLIYERMKEATRTEGIFAYEPQPITDATWRVLALALVAQLRATADEIERALDAK